MMEMWANNESIDEMEDGTGVNLQEITLNSLLVFGQSFGETFGNVVAALLFWEVWSCFGGITIERDIQVEIPEHNVIVFKLSVHTKLLFEEAGELYSGGNIPFRDGENIEAIIFGAMIETSKALRRCPLGREYFQPSES